MGYWRQFKQAIEQAFGNANSLRAKFATVVAGTTKTAFDIAGFASEREKMLLPIFLSYGRTPKYRFIKGEEDKELKPFQRRIDSSLGKPRYRLAGAS